MTEDLQQEGAPREARIVGWARVYPALRPSISRSLRRGAWYPIVDDTLPDRVSVLMGRRPVDVPRRLLKIRRARPQYFTVVSRVGYQRDGKRESLYNLGKQYAVCPICSHRNAIWGRPVTKQCSECAYEGEVGWWEE